MLGKLEAKWQRLMDWQTATRKSVSKRHRVETLCSSQSGNANLCNSKLLCCACPIKLFQFMSAQVSEA